MSTFVERRDEVIEFLRKEMIEGGALVGQAVMATACVKLWNSKDVDNLHKCINSDLPETVIRSIVHHDYNGLSKNDEHFLPKSSQFQNV